MEGIPYTDHNGQKAVMSMAEAVSTGLTHSYVEYALGLPLYSGNHVEKNLRALFLRLHDMELAALFNMGTKTVSDYRTRFHLLRPYGNQWSAEEIKTVAELSKEDASDSTGRSVVAVKHIRTRLRKQGVQLIEHVR